MALTRAILSTRRLFSILPLLWAIIYWEGNLALRPSGEEVAVTVEGGVRPTCASADEAADGKWEPGPDESQPDIGAFFRTSSGCYIPDWNHVLEYFTSGAMNGKTLYLVGDSQSNRMYDILRKVIEENVGPYEVLKTSETRDVHRFHNFYGLSPTKHRPKLHQHGEGPMSYGKTHPHTTDCSGCVAEHIFIPALGTHVIMHTMEYSRDTEMYSLEYDFTQEAIFRAYAEVYPPDFVVWNNGVHDIVSTGGRAEVFAENVEWTLQLILDHTPGKVIFWSCLPPEYEPEISHREQSTNNVLQFNNAAKQVMQASPRAHYLDVFSFGDGDVGKLKHHDNIHMDISVYEIILRIIFMQLELQNRQS